MSGATTRVMPGFRLTLISTVLFTALVVVVPLAGLFVKSSTLSLHACVAAVTSDRALLSYRLTFLSSLAAGSLNAVFGLLIAWVLVRYEFPGRALVDALVDLPFALPTAIAGLVLTTLYSEEGLFGKPLAHLGVKVAFTPLGIVLALTFVGLPFVVRAVQPVLESIAPEVEEAALGLGATRFQVFRFVIFPTLLPAMLTGFTLAFARALGEYGSIVFISGNIQMKTEITPLLIVTSLEQYDYAGATALAVVMLSVSFFLLLLVNLLQKRMARLAGNAEGA